MKKLANSFITPFTVLLILLLFLIPKPASAQVEEARQAIDRGEYVKAVDILSQVLSDRPAPDAYLYLGIAYRHIKEYQKAEDIFNEGSKRYPTDPRFHNELAELFLENNDAEAAKSALRQALTVDPSNAYASDRLATIDMSEGQVQPALRAWNRSGRPFINDILHNYYLNFGSWVVRRAVTFHPASTLRYSQWKTTEARLFETGNFSNAGIEIEPTRIPDQYNAIVRTTNKTNSFPDFLFNAFKGAPFDTTFFNVWNIRNSGINFNASYRWDEQRRRVEGDFKIPLPVAGLMFLDLGSGWRSENWNLSSDIVPGLLPEAHLLYKATAMRGGVKYIPDYRVELAAGFEYRNRAARGNLPQLFTDNLNTGLFTAATNLRLADRTYQSRLHLEGFAARRSIIGNTQFTGGVAELDNRVTLSQDTRTFLDWSVRGGTARGQLPVEDYFLLGLDQQHTVLPLRAHKTARHGQYGYGPMGTDFVLVNTDVERRLATIPFFNTLNIPFIVAKWEVFFDGAKTWDRNHVFQPSGLLLDTGAGLRFETPTHSLNFVAGRALHEGNNLFFVYYERRIW